MDNKEAILRIRDHIAVHHIGEGCHIKIFEALCMAIEALEKSQWTKEGHQIDIEKSAQNILDRVQQKLGISAEQLMDLVQAYQDGRCVVVPENYNGSLFQVEFGEIFSSDRYAGFMRKLGKKLFLTREAAEAYLKGEKQ